MCLTNASCLCSLASIFKSRYYPKETQTEEVLIGPFLTQVLGHEFFSLLWYAVSFMGT